jgi:hypothetical protein
MEEIFNKLIEKELTPNSFYVLYCIGNNIKPHNFVNSSLSVAKLKQDGWLEENLQLTSKSIIFTTEIESYFKKAKKKTTKDLLGDNFTNNIKTYVEIFPNRKLSSGKYARVNPKNLENSFRWFFENFTYSWETILKATDMYLSKQQDENYKYTRTSMYFIRKQDSSKIASSDLADYCEIVESGETIQDKVIFKERVV